MKFFGWFRSKQLDQLRSAIMALSAEVQNLVTQDAAVTAAISGLSKSVDAAVAAGIGQTGLSAEDKAALATLGANMTADGTTISSLAQKLAAATPVVPPTP